LDDELGTPDPALIKAKFELKFDRGYKDHGKIPGILVDENKRRKLVQELGAEMVKQPAVEKSEEEKVAPVPSTLSLVSAMQSSQT